MAHCTDGTSESQRKPRARKLGSDLVWDPPPPAPFRAPPCAPSQASGLSGGATLPKANFAQASRPGLLLTFSAWLPPLPRLHVPSQRCPARSSLSPPGTVSALLPRPLLPAEPQAALLLARRTGAHQHWRASTPRTEAPLPPPTSSGSEERSGGSCLITPQCSHPI